MEKCTAINNPNAGHMANPAQIVKGGALCIECGGFIPNEKPRGIPATMYHIFDKLALLLVVGILVSGVGCRGVNRLLGQEAHDNNFDMGNINPDDYFVTGTTAKDHASVYFTLAAGHKVASVEIQRADGWYTLQRPDVYDYLDSYQLFTIPGTGVYFGDLAYKDAAGTVHLTSDAAAPTGTRYRIHVVKL